MDDRPQRRASRLETVGAWLRIWTPRRDRRVPEPHWERIAIGAALVLSVLVALAVGLTHHSSEARRVHRDTVTRAERAAALKERARLQRVQAPHRDRAGVSGPPSRAAQRHVVAALEASITRDALRRLRSGEVDTRTRSTLCQPFVRPSVPHPPLPPAGARDAGYECLAVTAETALNGRVSAARAGYPFWARVDFRSGRYTWCKVNPRPGEHGAFDELAFAPLPRVCDLLRDT